MELHRFLGLPTEGKRVVSLCGGGGKTTLLYALARESRERDRTALFTTTHILPPAGEDIALLEPFSGEECRRAWERGLIAAAGSRSGAERKFTAPDEDTVSLLCREAEGVYIEADGAHRLPFKFPAPWEPVIRSETTHTVVLAGLSALGRRTEETFHRTELARTVMDVPEHVTEELIARSLWLGYARYSPIFFLNQADTPELRAAGERIALILHSYGAEKVAVGSLHKLQSDR